MEPNKSEQPDTRRPNQMAPTWKLPDDRPELAATLEQDPRYIEIKAKLIAEWEIDEDQDICSADGQLFQFGNPAAQDSRPSKLDQFTRIALEEDFHDATQAYVDREEKDL